MELVHKTPPPLLTALVVLCATCDIGLALFPVGTAVVLVVLMALSLFATGTRGLLKLFILFLVFQDVLQVFAGGESTLGILIKRADEPMVLIYGAMCLLLSGTVHRTIGRSRSMLVALVVCYLALILSSIPPMSGLLPAALDLALFSKPLCIFIIGVSLHPTDEEITHALRPTIYFMLAVVLFAVVFLVAPQLQDAYIGDVRAPDERLGFLSAQGFFNGPATYSWFATATAAVAYAAYLTYTRTYYLVISVVSAAFVLLSWRRKSILAVLCILLISLLVRRSKSTRVRAVAVVAVSVLTIVTVLTPYVGGLWQSTVTEYGSKNPYASARGALYFTSLLIARDYFPLGTGLATFGSHASKLYYSEVYRIYGISEIYGLSPMESNFITDTFWPMVLGEGGVVAIIAYGAFFWMLLRASWSAARRLNQTPAGSFIALTSLFVLVGSLIESTASHLYGSALQAVLVLIPAGILWERERRGAAVGSAIP